MSEAETPLIEPEEWRGVWKIHRIARFLMAERPYYAERTIATDALPELASATTLQEGVVRFEYPTGPPVFIVLDRGTRYTTSSRPAWASAEDDVVIRVPEPEDALLIRLENACSEFEQQFGAERYRGFRLDELLQAVSAYYEPGDLDVATHEDVLVQQLLLEVPQESDDLTQSAEAARHWAEQSRDQLLAAYRGCMLSGEAILDPLVVLHLLVYSVISANELFDIGLAGPMMSLVQAFRAANPTTSYRPLPAFEIEHYLSPLSVAPDEEIAKRMGMAVRRGAEHVQRGLGDWFRDTARQQVSVYRFESQLYEGLLTYRCAYRMFDALLALRPSLTAEMDALLFGDGEVERAHYLCEEMRVEILSCLGGPWTGWRPDFADPRQFGHWLERLQGLDPAEAKQEAQEMALRLGYPPFLRDLALGTLLMRADDEGEIARGIRLVREVAELLEEHLAENFQIGEPNYLSGAYEELAAGLERVGRQEEARRYKAMSTAEYIDQRLASLLS